MKILLSLFCFACIFHNAMSDDFEVGFNELSKFKNSNKNASIQHSAYGINQNVINKLLANDRLTITQFPISKNEMAMIYLKRTENIFDEKTEFYVGLEKVPAPLMYAYEGFIENKANSKVLLTIVNGQLFLVVDDGFENVYFFPSVKNDEEYILNYSSENSTPGFTNDKDTPDDYTFLNELKRNLSKKDKILSEDLLELELAYESDTEVFKACGSNMAKTQAYIMTLLLQVSRLYEEFIGIKIKPSFVRTWSDNPSDPYDAKGDWLVLLDKAKAYWENNNQYIPRDVYHVSTSISYGGGGFGYFDALCGNKVHGMAVTSLQCSNNLPNFNFAYDVYIIAHELGHNLNAQHTHSCFWNNVPLDTCIVDNACLPEGTQPKPNPGSIMSYCGGTNNEAGLGYQVRMIFRPENIAIMRESAEKAECLTKIEKPYLLLISPIGNEYYEGIDSLPIKWKAFKVDKINILYSEDGGFKWNLLEENVSTSINDYKWIVPRKCLNQLMIRIISSTDSNVLSHSWKNFSIKPDDPEKLVLYYPLDGNTNDEQYCHLYNAVNINAVQFTVDRFGNYTKSALFSGENYLKATDFNSTFEEMTITFWMNLSNLNGSQHIIGTNWAEGWSFSAYYWGQLGISLYVDGKGVPEQLWGGSLQADKWYYIAITFDGKTATIYVDGAMKAKKVWDNAVTLNKFTNTPIYVGARSDNEYFSGNLDEIKIFKRALTIEEIMAMVDVNDISIKHQFDISPEPTSSQTTISFNLETDTQVSISISDIFGNEVEKLLNNEFYSSGIHSVQFATAGLSSGVYFCTMRSGDRVETRNFLVVE